MNVRSDASSAATDWPALATAIAQWGRELGFEHVGIADTELSVEEEHLQRWLAAGRHGEMDYMARHGTRRARPAELVPGTVRVISARMNYWPDDAADAAAVLADPAAAYIARYALGRDYHKVLRARLQDALRSHRRRDRRLRLPRVHRQRARARSRARRQGRTGLARQAHAAAHARHGFVLLPGRDLHEPAAAGHAAGVRTLRHLHRMHRRMSHRRHRRALRARCAPLHLLPDDRTAGVDPRGAAPAHRQSRLRLRRLPARVSVEQVRRYGKRGRLPRGAARTRPGHAAGTLRVDGRPSSTRAWPAARSGASATNAGCAISRWAWATRRLRTPCARRFAARADDPSPLVREHVAWALDARNRPPHESDGPLPSANQPEARSAEGRPVTVTAAGRRGAAGCRGRPRCAPVRATARAAGGRCRCVPGRTHASAGSHPCRR